MKPKHCGLNLTPEPASHLESADSSFQSTKEKESEMLESESTAKSQNYEGLSELEEGILTALLGRELYGLQIIQAFEDASEGKRRLSVGTLYPTLQRLEQKGLIKSRMEDRAMGVRGGARRKYFKISPNGARRLGEAQTLRERLYAWAPA